MKNSKTIKILLCVAIAAIGLALGACSNPPPSYEKLSAPKNLRVEDGVLVWDEVEHAVGYAVYVENDEHLTTEARFDLSELIQEDEVYELNVIAIGDFKLYANSDETRFEYKYVAPEIIVPTPSLKYTLLDDESGYEVSGPTMVTGRIVIPDYYEGLPVKRIANAAFGSKATIGLPQITNNMTTGVRLPSTLEEIGDDAFTHCTAITKVIIPDSVKVIGEYAFWNCINLDTELPSNLVELSEGAFYGCRKLTSITIPDSVTRLGDYAFCYCSSLSNIRFPQNIEYFGIGALAATKWIQNQPKGIVIVQGYMCGYSGFVSDGSEIVIPSDVKHITGCSFTDLVGKDIALTIPDGVTIGDCAFYEFKGLKSIKLPSDLTCIPEYSFYYCETLESITIPDGVTEIGIHAFERCSALTSVELPQKLEKIGEQAFMFCSALMSIELPSELKEIGVRSFMGCSALTSIELSQKLEKIGEYAFMGCSKLTTLRIPNSVTVFEGSVVSSNFTAVIISPTLAASLSDVSSIAKYYITCTPEENEYDYVDIYTNSEESWKNSWMKNKNPFYLYVENEQDLPDDGGNYWHYAEDGKTPVIWEVQSNE